MNVNKERQVRNSLIYLAPPVLAGILPLLTLPLFTRVLSKEDFGAFALAQVYGVFVAGLINMGLATAYERNFFEYRNNTKSQASLLYGILLCVFVAFSVAILITWFMSENISELLIGNRLQGSLVFWSTCSLCVVSFKQYFLLYFRNTEDASSYARYCMDEMLLNTFFSILLVFVYNFGVIGLAIGPLLGSLTVFIILIARFLRHLNLTVAWQPVKNSLSLGLPLTPLALFKVLGAQSDKYLIGLLGTVGGVGLYSIGQRFGYLVFLWITALQNVFSPQVYQQMFSLSQDEGSKSIGHYLTPFAFLSAGGALIIALFSQEALIILTTPQFHDASDVATIFALVYSITFWSKLPQLTYTRKTYINSLLSLFTNILNFFCFVAGIRLFGMIGAAWAILISNLFSVFLTIYLGQLFYPIQWEVRKLIVIYGYLFIATMTLIYFRYIDVDIITLIGFKLIALLGYIYIGKKMGFISHDKVVVLRDMLKFKVC